MRRRATDHSLIDAEFAGKNALIKGFIIHANPDTGHIYARWYVPWAVF